jgi:hypothetical protein
MFRLSILIITMIGVFVFLILGFLRLLPWEVASILITVFIGITSLLLTYISLKQKQVD